MRILLALAGVALAVVLLLLLWHPASPPPARVPASASETAAMPATSSLPQAQPPAGAVPQPRPPAGPLAAPPRALSPIPGALLGEPPPMPVIDAAVARARAQERDYAYWDMKLAMLRKISQCVGDKLQTQGAAQIDYHFKREGDAWLADRAVMRDPNDEERQKLGAVDWRGADRELAQKCISEAFAGVTMPMTGGTNELQGDYTVRGQIMFPTTNDRAWKETGVNPQ